MGKQDALSKLKAAREGGDKRALTFEAKKEEELYDVLEDEEYAKLVAKRREEGGRCTERIKIRCGLALSFLRAWTCAVFRTLLCSCPCLTAALFLAMGIPILHSLACIRLL